MVALPVETAIAIEELLRGAERCLMHFFGAFYQTEPAAELIVKLVCGISHDIQPLHLTGPCGPNVLTITCPPGFTPWATVAT